MRKMFLFIAAVFCVTTITFAQEDTRELTVYDGTATNNYIPYAGEYGNEYACSQFVIPASELEAMKNSVITQLRFYLQSPKNYYWSGFVKVYMKEGASQVVFSLNNLIGVTDVYQGGIHSDFYGVMSFTLRTPYFYQGGNLLIAIETYSPGNTYNTSTFYGQTTADYTSIYAHNHNSPNYLSGPTEKFIPKTTFIYTLPEYSATVEPDGWVHYDDGNYQSSIGYGGVSTKPFHWGIMIPSETVSDSYLTEVSIYVHHEHQGSATLYIYQGGTSPDDATLLHEQEVSLSADDDFQIIQLLPSVQIDPSQDTWIVFDNTDNIPYPASYSRIINTPNARWITEVKSDGTEKWVIDDRSTAWMIRGRFASEPEDLSFVRDLEVNDITSTSARLTWEGNAERYDILYKTGVNGLHMDFEDGLGDWTTIDADGDGYNWYWTEGESQIHHEGLGSAGSASYFDDQVGALTPDNYLVSPLMDLGGVFSFWASESNSEGYNAEHFGVAVSTTGNTDAADFTMIPGAEWTLDDNRVWHQYKADLSAYEGQRGYVAIRHFECTNQFRLIVDDIELTPDHIIRNVSGTEYTLTDLLPETNYDVTVAPHGAIDEGGSIIIPSEYLATTSFTTLPGPIDPTVETDGWVYYDTGIKAANIGIGDNLIYWGIMIPGGTVEATHLTKVSAYAPRYGDLTVYIYQGGETPAEGALLHQQDISWEDIDSFQEAKMTPVVTIDPSQDLWIVLGNTGHINQPAVYCNIENAHHARWICTSDATGNYAWHNMQELYPYHCQLAWMIRGLFSSETGIEEIVESRKTKDRCAQRQKLLIDGELYILRDGKIFNAQGARVK